MGKEKSERIQTSILNAAEKKALKWLADRLPGWVTSDMLTYTGVIGAVVCALGFILADKSVYWLWLANLGLFINWYGDSLDGTLARVRNQQRPKYGFFIDHSMDVVTISVMCIGAGFSPLFDLNIAFFVLVGYMSLSIYTYVSTIVADQFRLTYGAMGPTEFRLIFVILNIIFMYTGAANCSWEICGTEWSLYNIIGFAVGVILVIVWFSQFFKDRSRLAKEDPLVKK